MKRPFRYYGDPILRQKAKQIVEIDDEVRQAVEDLIDSMQGKPGWGLSAPQIGYSLRIFVTTVPDARDEIAEHFGPLRVFINPVLSEPSRETRTHQEGCFSLPGVYPEVTRPAGITIEAMDLQGNSFKKELWGWQARVIMHENDHLNGVLSVDRASIHERRKLEQKLREIKKRQSHS